MNFYNAKLFMRVNVSCKNTKKAKEIKKKLPFISEWKLFYLSYFISSCQHICVQAHCLDQAEGTCCSIPLL